ncbi:MAG: UDP-N-acetylglucosamine 2-epimerase [Bacteroidia bacterium]
MNKTIHILSSTRADFGFFLPLIRKFEKDNIKYKLVVFGTHLSEKHGYTLNEIKKHKIEDIEIVDTYIDASTPYQVNEAIVKVITEFNNYYYKLSSKTDILLGLGDRFELFAAVAAAKTYNLKFIHLSGGEETFGAIDNLYRHCLTIMGNLHFTNTKKNAERVEQLINHKANVCYSGSLTIDNILSTELYDFETFKKEFGLQLKKKFILTTFHPETVEFEKNLFFVNELLKAIDILDFDFVITMPNADVGNFEVRQAIQEFAKNRKNIFLIESFGSQGYYSALKYCYCVLGNSSSGIVEAASFAKYAVNIGKRQEGRERGDNVIDCELISVDIVEAVRSISSRSVLKTENIYGSGNASDLISKEILTFLNL